MGESPLLIVSIEGFMILSNIIYFQFDEAIVWKQMGVELLVA